MKGFALLLLLAGATACGASQPQATTPSKSNGSTNDGTGATSAQGADNPNRSLTKDECDELGAWITQVCHSDHTRQATVEGWCSDMVARTTAGNFTDSCLKTNKYFDFMCFRSSENAMGLRNCDRTADH